MKNITSLLEFCLTSTCFIFQGRYFEQQEGAAMGSPISSIVANLYMEEFETKAINSAPQPPFSGEDLWMTPLPSSSDPKKTSFLEHLNSIDEHIQFTCEEPGQDGSIPFQDILIIPNEEGSLKTTVYRKPTHTDLYLQWDSNHTVSSKYGVVGSLQHRTNTAPNLNCCNRKKNT